MAVLDASVLVALFHIDELYHAATVRWFDWAAANNEPLNAPVIVLSEVAAALSRGKNEPSRADDVVQLLRRNEAVRLVPISQPLAEQAAYIAISCRIRGCDAIYVALAQQLDQPLITFDEQQFSRSRDIIRVQKPEI